MIWIPAILLFIFFTVSTQASNLISPSADHLTRFVVMGDMPYTDTEYALLEQPDGTIAKAIRTLNPPVLIHLGDFKQGRISCSDELFLDHYRQIAQLNPHRVVYTPGDNEWVDCDRFTFSARYDELERLNFLRQLFFHQDHHQLTKDIPGLVRQEGFIENARWESSPVVFATLHVPGTNNGRMEILRSNLQDALDEADYRDQANEQWLRQLFIAAESASALVIAFHADIFNFDHKKPACTIENRTNCDGYRKLRDLIKRQVAQFAKPVLVIHGDSQAYCLHQPYTSIPNLWRLNAPGDYRHIDASQVVFDPENKNTPFTASGVLDRKPAPAICSYSIFGSSRHSPSLSLFPRRQLS
ncbi:Calcineurin-like phosphoesterase [Nitrosomonas ureae]|uniref:Calcineurin-like phosphoesterase n=2 Tax=Nitrosomonas ureae TaxID=44577 RepID=A0A285BXP3_9PROT|nr:Calcineurin-like phosphoesterase [Nitrosomonas ureae]